MLGQAGHRHDAAADNDHKARTGAQTHLAHIQRVTLGRTRQLGVVAEGILRFGNADRQLAITQRGQLVQRLFCGSGVAYAARAVDLRGDGLDLIRQRRVQLVGVLHLGAVVQDGQHGLGQCFAALAALGKDLAQGAGHTGLAADVINNIHLLRSVGGEGVDGNADRQTKALQVFNVAGQVHAARTHGLGVGLAQIGLGHAAVGLERAHRGHQHNGGRVQPGIAALDVKELLRAQIRAEAGLGHNVVGQLEAQPGGNGTVAAVGNVGERTAVDDGGVVLQRLDKVRVERVLQKCGHRARRADLPGGDGLAVVGVGADDAGQAGL